MNRHLKIGVGVTALFLAGALGACTTYAPNAQEQSKAAALGDWGVDLSQRELTTKPGDDFNRYANGLWLDSFEIPADLSTFSKFTKLRLDAEADVRAIIEELSETDASDGSLEQKVGDYFEAWMDVDALDAIGVASIQPYLDQIYAIDNQTDLMKAYASFHGDAPFGVGIIPDPADTTRYMAFIGQSGIGMPDRDYYLKTEEKFVNYRTEYKKYVSTILSLAGQEDADVKADAIIGLETRLAEVHWTQEDSRDIQKIYNPMSKAELAAAAPEFNWDVIFDETQLNGVETFLVAQPSAIKEAGEIFAAAPMDLLRDYLAYQLLNNNAQFLSSDFDNARFEFFSKTLRGVEEQRDRWKRGVNQIDAGLGEAVGQIYVDRHFPPAYKEQMLALVGNLTDAFKERLMHNEWMDEATREQALLKLSTFEPRIGFTDKWTDYGPLMINKGELLGNALALTEFQWQEQVDRLDGPVDRQIWGYPPQTVNASYSPLLNQITFPAGILQPPFFDPNADPAVNYGAIGAVIGHEIGHGFDDQGRRFDELGRIRDWWSEASNERFQKKADTLGAQYDGYEAIEGQNVNGQLTMGENIGDLGGLQMGYAAYHRYLDQTSGGVAPVIDGMTGDQRFFLGWAQVWQAAYREDALLQRLLTDPHSPPEFRINGVVRNLDAWYEAFGVEEGDALYLAPEDRVRIW